MKNKVAVVFVCMGNKVSGRRKALLHKGSRLVNVETVTPLDTPNLLDTPKQA